MLQSLKVLTLMGYTVLIGYVSLASDSSPDAVVPDLNSFGVPDLDKMAHISAYLVFAILCSVLLRLDKIKTIFWAAIVVIIYSAALEYLQVFVPLREPSWLDFLANFCGVVIGSLCVIWWQKNAKHKPRKGFATD